MITHEHALKNGTVLNNYIIIKILGAGGFGITYLAKDRQLGMEVVIKEYFPSDLAIRKNDSTIISKSSNTENDFKKGMQRFEEEAQTLAKFNHPSIVKILGYFEANNTAYFVMEYEEGIDLSQYMQNKATPFTQEEILGIMMPVLEGLKEVHSHNYLHRDIKPGNILLRNKKGPVLIDFGASKLALGEASKSITSMLTEGYAPLEQYSTDVKQQGSFTDLYAIGAVIYKMITGKVPPSSQTRSYQLLQDGHDPFKLLSSLNLSGYDTNFLKAVDRALAIKAKDRQQSILDFQADIAGELKAENPIKDNPKKKEKSNTLNIIVVLLILVAGIVYFYKGQGQNQTSQVQITQSEIEEALSPHPVVEKSDELENTRRKLAELKREKLEKLRREKAQTQRDELERLRKEKAERERVEVEEKTKYSLTITTIPFNARVQITNIKPRYTKGIKLKKGTYKIKVSKKGYRNKLLMVPLKKNSTYSVELEKEKEKQKAKVKKSSKKTVKIGSRIWQKRNDGRTRTWKNAMSYCNNLSLDGYSDWRLPSKWELEGLYANRNRVKFVGAHKYFWSSSSKGSTDAWIVIFDTGNVTMNYKTKDDYYVRCVH